MNYLEAEDLTTGYGRQVISEALNCSFEAELLLLLDTMVVANRPQTL